MLRKIFTLGMLFLLSFSFVQAQEEEAPDLTISGSVDTYWKYDFSGNPNIQTSFANEQNSISIGMINLIASQEVGKASFVADISFGPRGQSQSLINAGADNNSFHVQNLYMSYALSEKVSLTAGYMGTFVGYEVISPAGNFNYSTSYLFTSGPFQNAGIKADIAFSDKVGLMVGLFNDWNIYQDMDGVSDIGAQLYLNPVDGWDVYLNFLTGPFSGTIVDLTTGYQITDAFYLGLNAADYTYADSDEGGYTGVALYPQYSISEAFGLGLRYEYFMTKEVENGAESASVNAFTLTGSLKAGPLTVIPEFRLDSGEDGMFMDSDAMPASSASQFLIGAVYAF
ncbi:outer membrane beta-barrel protein [Flammeovirgaceae bacterium SG7u.111]|nr:outer membrane beta-barrel protein [Flammeovirgaceae bacterium SG7u.132]WPO35291.1 outer membrane beta-barrel protein [Flammeovirgaceae bacterium SG7u.111]